MLMSNLHQVEAETVCSSGQIVYFVPSSCKVGSSPSQLSGAQAQLPARDCQGSPSFLSPLSTHRVSGYRQKLSHTLLVIKLGF